MPYNNSSILSMIKPLQNQLKRNLSDMPARKDAPQIGNGSSPPRAMASASGQRIAPVVQSEEQNKLSSKAQIARETYKHQIEEEARKKLEVLFDNYGWSICVDLLAFPNRRCGPSSKRLMTRSANWNLPSNRCDRTSSPRASATRRRVPFHTT